MKPSKYLKAFLISLFIIFSLAPCKVKDVMFSTTITEYTKPLNKSKTLASCEIVQSQDNNKVTSEQNTLVSNDTFEIRTKDYLLINYRNIVFNQNHNTNKPPKYILFKQLKIDTLKKSLIV